MAAQDPAWIWPSLGLGSPQHRPAASKITGSKEGKIADGGRAVESNLGGEKSNVERYKNLKENCSEEVVGWQHGAAGLILPHLPAGPAKAR